MAVDSIANLVRILKKYQLLDAEQFKELAALQNRYPDPKALARALVVRGLLTPYQVNQIFLGKYADLSLGSYVLLERLGEGGMGTVFKARHRTMARIVAVKVIRKERLGHPEAVRRFRREIKLVAQLNHPNIVKAFDADEVSGKHLLVMEYVEGTDLAKLIKQRGQLPFAEACEYVRQTALGLQHAHECGLIHRDIKPLNLLISSEGRAPNAGSSPGAQVKILDMGLARFEHPTEDAQISTFLTQEGAVMGSPDYIAPEQAMGAQNVDIRADLYSLGCTLYHMVAGRVPFPGGSLGAKLVRHKLEEPELIESLRPDVPPALAALLRKLMAKKPQDRYQTPAEVAAAIDQLAASGFQVPVARQVAVQAVASFAPGLPAAPSRSLPEADSPAVGGDTFGVLAAGDAVTTTDTAWKSRRQAQRRRWLLLNLAGGAILVLFLYILISLLRSSGLRSALPTATSAPSSASDAGPVVPDDPLAGFVSLFNGKDLDGWEIKAGTPDSWVVRDGLLVCTGTAKNGWIATNKSYRDFVLRLEWRVQAGGTSGVFLRCPATGKPTAQGIKIQILDDNNPGTDLTPDRKSGSIHALVAPTRAPFKGVGEWNEFEIVCQGDRLKLTYNGEEALDVDLSANSKLAARAKEGYIALHSQAKLVEFRKLLVKELSPPILNDSSSE